MWLMFVVGALVMTGCYTSADVEVSEVEIRGCLPASAGRRNPLLLAAGEAVVIDDRYIVRRLVSFFPGMGSGREGIGGLLAYDDMMFVFKRKDGGSLVVYTKQSKYWGCDYNRYDLPVRGDLKGYLRALFFRCEIERSDVTTRGG